MIKKFLSFVIISLIISGNFANAKDVEIDEVLKEILRNSNTRKSLQYDLKASEEEANKAQKHWLPTLYVDSAIYETNDPAKNFMGSLYQRSVVQSDFDVNTINQTANDRYSKSALGINLPLYQGGAGLAYNKMAKNIVTSKKYDLKQTEIEQYSYAAATYIGLVSLSEQKIKLQKIAKNIDEILQNYSLGDKRNPIGYSGLLILQASQNKTESFLIDNEEKTKALYQILNKMGFESEVSWNVKEMPVENYINKYLNFENSQDYSFKTLALKAKSDAVKNQGKISKATNLPQLNLFAENYIFDGNRSSQSGYTAGVNLRWNFFDPFNYKNAAIANNKSDSARYEFLAYRQNEKAEIEYLNSQINSLQKAVELAKKNDDLMFKNVLISQRLFKSGSITASNLSDAIMKYLDNFIYLANAQMLLIDLNSKKLCKQKIDIDDILAK